MTTEYNFKKSNYIETFRKYFYETLTKIINEIIIPQFGTKLKFNIELGLFSSNQYGSYKISFTENENEVCYIIADTILGEWKIFKNK